MDFKAEFPNYDVDENGSVYKNGNPIKPFKSNKYLQVLLFDKSHQRHVVGVHKVVAMKFADDYFDGCVVHHKDGNTLNNCITNLEVMTRSEHCRKHGKENTHIANLNKGKAAWNKGMKMSEEFAKHCQESAIKRWQKHNAL